MTTKIVKLRKMQFISVLQIDENLENGCKYA